MRYDRINGLQSTTAVDESREYDDARERIVD